MAGILQTAYLRLYIFHKVLYYEFVFGGISLNENIWVPIKAPLNKPANI